MAVTDGDPRVIAAEVFGRLTALERSQAVRAFAGRTALVGKGRKYYPDDESPASVARQATVFGVFNAGLVLVFVNLFLVMALSGAGLDFNFGLVLWSGFVVIVGLCAWRYRQVNRFFVEHYPESLHRLFFKPGFDPPGAERIGGHASAGTERPVNPTAVIAAGDPSAVAPDLMARLTWLERNRVHRSLAHRLGLVGQGKRGYPDDEAPESIARRTILQGVSSAGWIAGFPMFVVMGFASAVLLSGPSAAAAWTVAVCGLLLGGLAGLVLARRRRVRRFFADSL